MKKNFFIMSMIACVIALLFRQRTLQMKLDSQMVSINNNLNPGLDAKLLLHDSHYTYGEFQELLGSFGSLSVQTVQINDFYHRFPIGGSTQEQHEFREELVLICKDDIECGLKEWANTNRESYVRIVPDANASFNSVSAITKVLTEHEINYAFIRVDPDIQTNTPPMIIIRLISGPDEKPPWKYCNGVRI